MERMDGLNASAEILREFELFKRREDAQPHMSYAHEKLRYKIITEGRIELLDEVLQIPPDGTPGVLSKNELRNEKNMFIAAITTFTRAAIEGGLPEEIAFAMSDGYIQTCENYHTVDDISRLHHRALREFTLAVAEHGNRCYNRYIEDAIRYILVHLHEKIVLEDIAEAVGISACHLSRVFKNATGQSVVDYIQKERVRAAGNMLIYSKYTMAEISEYLHFSTQSYFIKMFKKHMGVTPGEYRKNGMVL